MGWLGSLAGAALPMAGYYFGGGPMGAMAAGAIMGKLRHDEEMDRQQRTSNAAADAIAASWARKGSQSIPKIQWATGTPMGAALQGGVAGGMQGLQFKEAGIPQAEEGWLGKLFAGNEQKPNLYSRFGQYPTPYMD